MYNFNGSLFNLNEFLLEIEYVAEKNFWDEKFCWKLQIFGLVESFCITLLVVLI